MAVPHRSERSLRCCFNMLLNGYVLVRALKRQMKQKTRLMIPITIPEVLTSLRYPFAFPAPAKDTAKIGRTEK